MRGTGKKEMKSNLSQKNVKRVVIFTTILMGLIAVSTAWSGYQSASWSNKTTLFYSKANIERSESVKDALTANQLTLLDITLFTKWLEATAQNQTQLATFYVNHMRSEAKPAFDAWLAQDPLNNTNAPSSPFVMNEYVVQKRVDADTLENMASNNSNQAQRSNKISIEYVLTTVILALALFFAGMATRYETRNIQLVFAILSLVTFIYGLIQLISLWFTTG
jgi:hypothetical protein